MTATIYTVGHSSRTLDAFVDILKALEITVLADIRRFPRSKAHPHFGRETLEPELRVRGIEYAWLGDVLGGFRKGGYAAYMETDGFAGGLERLLALAARGKTAAMCAEKHWSQCHRRFISDQLTSMGHRVIHILDEQTLDEHRFLPAQLELKDLL
jgi:uncharacterized protein (DUF488 family)